MATSGIFTVSAYLSQYTYLQSSTDLYLQHVGRSRLLENLRPRKFLHLLSRPVFPWNIAKRHWH